MQYVSGPNIETREIFLFDKNLDGAVNLGTYLPQDMERILRRARTCYAGSNRLNPIAGQLSDKYVLTSTRYGELSGGGRQLATLAANTAPASTNLPGGTTTAAQDASGYNAHGGSTTYSANICLTPFSVAKTLTPPKFAFTNASVNPAFTYYVTVTMASLTTANARTPYSVNTPGQLMANGVVYPLQVSQSIAGDSSYLIYGGVTYAGNAGNAIATFPPNDGLTVINQSGTAEQINLTEGLFVLNGFAYKIESFGISASPNLVPGSRPSITFNGFWGKWDITAL